MADELSMNEARARLATTGAGGRDLAWLDEIRWDGAAVPPVATQSERSEFARREAMLNKSVSHLSFAERGASPEGKLAASLGARIADWDDREENE